MEEELEQSQYPVRVIDIEATLQSSGGIHFVVRRDWCFHTISHTWTKGIRDLSEAVGRLRAENQHHLSYDHLFQSEDFRGDATYVEFLEFLHILHGDGVEFAWFDAVCINQTDDHEKAREILNMGKYYSCSIACYVLCHGFGQQEGGEPARNFQLFNRDPVRNVDSESGASSSGGGHETFETCWRLSLPRWFRRVWTLQEFVLPKQLFFVVELELELQRAIMWAVNEGAFFLACPCIQGYPSHDLEEVFCRYKADRHVDIGTHKIETLRKSSECVLGRCNTVCGIKRITSSFNEKLYLVSREAYFCVVEIARLMVEHDALFQPRDIGKLRNLRDLNVTCCLDGRVSNAMGGVEEMIKEVSQRNCSENHEEDRVLGILGLLIGAEGKEGISQLRPITTWDRMLSDKKAQLAWQLLQLFKYLQRWNQTLLLQLVSHLSQDDCEISGMAWAPGLGKRRDGFIGDRGDIFKRVSCGKIVNRQYKSSEDEDSAWLTPIVLAPSFEDSEPDKGPIEWASASMRAEEFRKRALRLHCYVLKGHILPCDSSTPPTPVPFEEYMKANLGEMYVQFGAYESIYAETFKRSFCLVVDSDEKLSGKTFPLTARYLLGGDKFGRQGWSDCNLSQEPLHQFKIQQGYTEPVYEQNGYIALPILFSTCDMRELLDNFEVWLILWHGRLCDLDTYCFHVCVGSNRHRLVDVGHVHLELPAGWLDNREREECTLGGSIGCVETCVTLPKLCPEPVKGLLRPAIAEKVLQALRDGPQQIVMMVGAEGCEASKVSALAQDIAVELLELCWDFSAGVFFITFSEDCDVAGTITEAREAILKQLLGAKIPGEAEQIEAGFSSHAECMEQMFISLMARYNPQCLFVLDNVPDTAVVSAFYAPDSTGPPRFDDDPVSRKILVTIQESVLSNITILQDHQAEPDHDHLASTSTPPQSIELDGDIKMATQSSDQTSTNKDDGQVPTMVFWIRPKHFHSM